MAQDYAGRLRRQALLPRVLTAVLGVPLLLGLLWVGGPWWLVLLAAVVAIASMEFAPLRRLSGRGELVLRLMALFAFAIVATGPETFARWAVGGWALVLLAFGLLPLLRMGVSPEGAVPSERSSVLLGIAYLAIPCAVLVRWRLELPPYSVLAFLLVIWANDIAAYFIGLAVGRHKLAPRISPGKSWEGALGGLAGGVVAGIAVAAWVGLEGAPAAAWAATITAVSQAGDLFESALKRRAGVKDSGRLLPGHGGVLDRFDGILVASPAAYVLLQLLSGR